MLQSETLTYAYEGQPVLQFPALHCKAGEGWLILGQSGCGKTTLLHLLGGLLTPKSGDIKINGTLLNQLEGGKRDRFRGQHIGIIFQQSHFIKSLTVEENLMLAQSLPGKAADRSAIRQILDQLNVGHKLNSRPDNLSQGEQQRVAIARALVNRPQLILADEPTSALDDNNCREVVRLLQYQAREANATLLIVTHDVRLKDHIPQQIHLEVQHQPEGEGGANY